MRLRVVAVAVAALAVVLAGAGPAAADPPVRGQEGAVDSSAEGAVTNEGIEASAGTTATITTDGATTAGVPFRREVYVTVPRRCWYGPGMTGAAYFEYWKPGGAGRSGMTGDAYAAQGLLHPGFEAYEGDTEGRWYEATCAVGVPGDEWLAYHREHPPVYVEPGDPAPAVVESVDPAVLAQVAAEHMQLPTGTMRWNPSLAGSGATVVNMETFVWVEDATTEVQVTASVPGVWSQVQARMTGMTVSAPNTTDVTCPDPGTPYTAGMTGSSCEIVFRRSSANQAVKAGQRYPTVTVTATSTWESTWTSSLDPTPRTLPAQTRTVTAEVPVAEVQSVVTG